MTGKDGLKEFRTLSSDSVFSMAKIAWWLLKYVDEYNYIKETEDVRNSTKFKGEQIVLPSLKIEPSEEDKFLCLYESLDKLSRLHRNENYFKQEMAIYKEVVKKPLKVSEWLKKNQKLGVKDYACFLLDYLDYDINNNEYHLKVFLSNNPEIDIFVNRNDFRNIVNFIEVFDTIYW